jgi:phytoene synthase
MNAVSPKEARAHAEAAVKRSRTSFAAGMSILPRPRREAMHAIYAFCREVDDIADGEAAADDKTTQLAGWRAEVDRVFAGEPQTPIGAALVEPVRRFDLPKEEFLLMIEGMEMDAAGPIVAPPMETLLRYTRRVAGAVGMLSMPVFGAPRSETSARFALALGDAFQLTNILRDVAEDAAVGRLYLPRETLEAHGAPLSPREAVASPKLADVARDVGALAKSKFAAARVALGSLDWRVLRPALLMMGVYEEYLKRMAARGWRIGSAAPRLSGAEKAAISLRWFMAPKLAG